MFVCVFSQSCVRTATAALRKVPGVVGASVEVSLANGGTATLAYTTQGHEQAGPLHPLVVAVEGVGFEAALLATPPPIAIPPPTTPQRALGGGAALPVGGYGGARGPGTPSGRSQGGGAMEVTMDLARPTTTNPPQPITRYHTLTLLLEALRG